MATLNLSGFQGETHLMLGSFDLYLCSDTFQLNTKKTASTTQSGRIYIGSAPNNARWFKGYIHGLMTAETEYSMYSTTGNGGAPFHFENTNGFTVERLKVDGHVWDPIRPGTGSHNPNIVECWIQDTRDDSIEADSLSSTLTAVRCFFDNVHTYISTTPGGSAASVPHRWVFEDCLGSLANNHRDSREKRKYPWNDTNYGSGQPWKNNGGGQGLTFRLKNCTLMWQRLPKQSTSQHRLIPTNAVLDSGSGGNVFVWRGPQTTSGNGGVAVVSVPKIGGGTINVPESILGTGSERTRIMNIFTFTDSQAHWDNKVTAWMTNVWGTTPPATPPVAVNDTNYNLQAGGVTINVPVLSNDSNVSGSVNPVVTKQGTTSGPVTTAVSGTQLAVTSHATNTGAWSQTYRVTTTHGQSDAVASGTVTAAPVDPPPPSGIEVRPHNPAWELTAGGILTSITLPETTGVRQGIFSKDSTGAGDSHVSLFITIGNTFSLRMQDPPDVNIFLETPVTGGPFTEVEILFVFGPTGSRLYIDRVLKAEQSIPWDLVGNTEPLIVGADSSHTEPGETGTRLPYLGTIESLDILTMTQVSSILGSSGGGASPGGPVQAGESAVNPNVPPSLGLVHKSQIRANLAAAKSELLSLAAPGASAIDSTKPADGAIALQSDLRANFGRIRSAILALGGASTINHNIPQDNAPVSRSMVRNNFAAIKTEITGRFVAATTPVDGPAFQQAGARDDRTSPANNLTPAYPITGLQANDIFFAHIVIHADVNQNCSGSGWELIDNVIDGDLGSFVFRRTAVGNETGSATFVWTGDNTTGVRVATSWIVRYRGGTRAFEGVTVAQNPGLAVSFPSVSAHGSGRRAIAFLAVNGPSTSETNPTGESGGDWVWRARIGTTSGDDAAAFLYDANLPQGGTISGGTVTQNGGDRWSVVAFAAL